MNQIAKCKCRAIVFAHYDIVLGVLFAVPVLVAKAP